MAGARTDGAAALDAVRAVLRATGTAWDELGDGRLVTVLAGERKRTLPVLVVAGDRSLEVVALLVGAPDEGHAQVYELLLRHNRSAGPIHFALDDAGDVLAVGRLPLAAADEPGVDELLGGLLDRCDRAFDQVLRLGFATYLAAEQRWRASVGLPPNPVGHPRPADGPGPATHADPTTDLDPAGDA